jgi:hypothetical protein
VTLPRHSFSSSGIDGAGLVALFPLDIAYDVARKKYREGLVVSGS